MNHKKVLFAALAATLVVSLSSLTWAAPYRNPIRRPHANGSWQDDAGPNTTYVQPASTQTRQAFSYDAMQFKAGDMAKLSRTANLMVERNVLATVKSGQEFKVLDVQGPWVAAQVNVDGKPVRGWFYYNRVAPAGK